MPESKILKFVRRLRNSLAKRRHRYPAATYLGKYYNPLDVRTTSQTPIAKIFLEHHVRPTTKWHHYFEIYESEFGPFRGRPVKLLEIGVQEGGSLEIWRSYFGPQAVLFGVDIDPLCGKLSTEDLPVRIGSQNDPAFLKRVIAEMGGVDIVVDDGSHVGADQIASFKTMFPLLSTGGLYLIEDVHAAYWREYEGGVSRPGTIVEFAKALIDDMNGWYHEASPKTLANARECVDRVSIYDSVIAITKTERSAPRQVFAGAGL